MSELATNGPTTETPRKKREQAPARGKQRKYAKEVAEMESRIKFSLVLLTTAVETESVEARIALTNAAIDTLRGESK